MIKRRLSARAHSMLWTVAALFAGMSGGAAMAYEGQPSPWQKTLQTPVTEVARDILSFYDIVNILIIAIAVFVGLLLLYVIFKFNERSNPTPSKTTHNTPLEVVWTLIPALILVVIAVPSFKLLYLQYKQHDPAQEQVLTIKATGFQWYWSHQYPDQGFSFDSTMIRDEDVLKRELGSDSAFDEKYGSLEGVARSKALYNAAKGLYEKYGMVRQLSTDNDVVVPVDTVIQVLVTAEDVIHNWTIPSFGSKTDAVPGRVTRTWFKAEKKGTFYGQCSELCGKDHSSMPITVRVVDKTTFNEWAAAMKSDNTKRAAEIIKQAVLKNKNAGKTAQLQAN